MNKEVLFIVHSFSSGGGAEKILASLISKLHERGGYEISLLEISHNDISWEPLPSDVHVLRPVLDETKADLCSKLRRGLMRRLLTKCPRIARVLVRKFKRYDLVVAFNYLVPTYLIYKSESSVAWTHGSIECLSEDVKNKKRLGASYKHIDRIVAIAQRTYKSIVDLYPEYESKTCLIYNGYPFDEIEKKANERADKELMQPALVFVGRLDGNKNPLRVLRVFSLIRERHPGCHLYYLGDGELRNELQEEIKETGLGECVHLFGHQRNPYPYLKQADCLISLSLSEGFQTVFVECLFLGVPFISSPAGAAVELSGEGRFGCVVESDQAAVDAFDHIIELKANDELAIERNCFVRQFTQEAQVETFCELAHSIMHKGDSAYE